MSFSISGGDELIRKLRAIGPGTLEEAGRALYQVGLIKLVEMKRRTPVEFGALRASEELERPVMTGGAVSVRFVAGGPSAPYALFVHEDLQARHSVGQAKFMESVVLESAPTLTADVAARMDMNRVVR